MLIWLYFHISSEFKLLILLYFVYVCGFFLLQLSSSFYFVLFLFYILLISPYLNIISVMTQLDWYFWYIG